MNDLRHLSHAGDPDVSADAAIDLSPVASAKVMQVVATLISERGPLTPTELERIYHQRLFIEPDWPHVKDRTVAKRASEMKTKLGVLRGTGVRREKAEALGLTDDLVTVHTRITEHYRRAA